MSNPAIEALDRAIAELEERLAGLPTLPSLAIASDEQVSLTIDRDAQVVALEIVPAALRGGLTALGDRIVELQGLALAAFASGQGSDVVELTGDPAPIARLPHLPGAPQLPPQPTRDQIEQVAAQMAAALAGLSAARAAAAHPRRAASELVIVQLDGAGALTSIEFRPRASGLPADALAADLLSTIARARAGVDGEPR